MSTMQVHPFRAYLRDVRDNWATVKGDLGGAARSARHLWPFVWRATLDDEVERAAMALAAQELHSEAVIRAVAEEFARTELAAETTVGNGLTLVD